MFRVVVVCAALLFLALPAAAQSPRQIPVTGTLADSAGTPLTGSVSVAFALYADAEGQQQLWSESQTLTLEDAGHFTAHLGAVAPVDLRVFADYPAIYLGITVADDSQMPLVELGSVPWAGYAEYCGSSSTVNDTAMASITTRIEDAFSGQLHDRYTDDEAQAAMGTMADSNPLNHNRVTQSEVVAALGGASNTNSLNHGRYTDVEAVAAVDARVSHWYGTWDASVSSGVDATTALPYNITVDKARDSSDLELTFSSNLRTYGVAADCCRWSIRVDGAQCPSAPIDGAVYINPGGNYHQHRTITGICSGLAAGTHTVEAWVELCPGYGVADCSTGWNSQTYLIAEEL